ncbi:MAG: OmpH family outer membrane protein [Bryobacteraceae bacterium]
MMRSSFVTAFFVCAFGVVLVPAASAQTKVGVIDLQRAVLGTADIKKASAELQAKFKPRQDELEKIQKEMAEIQEKLQNPQTPPAQAQDLQLRGQRDQREAQRLTEDLQADVERERNDVLRRAGQRMSDVAKKLADQKALDVVVDSSTTIFFKPALDLTEEAISVYDKTFPVK